MSAKRTKKQPNPVDEKRASVGRHEKQCSICCHPQKEEIEHEFVNWVSVEKTSTTYSVSRDAIYRHAHVFGLLSHRRRNVRVALERIIERAGEVEVNASAVVAAVTAYAKLNSRGELVERTENVDVNALFVRMSAAELDEYARTGTLPAWFQARLGATGFHSQESDYER